MRLKEYNTEAEFLKERIWQMINLIRGHLDYSEYSSVILLLLSLEKDGYLDDKILNSSPERLKMVLDLSIERANRDNKDVYREIYAALITSVHSINDIALFDLIRGVKEIHSSILEKYFAEIFDDILYKLSKSQGRMSGESILPIEISRFVCRLADPEHSQSVYNPFAGLASFPLFLPKQFRYFGQELNIKTWAVGALRLLAHRKSKNIQFIHGDSISQWPDSFKKFDLIISNPPFGLKLREDHRRHYPVSRTLEHFFIHEGLRLLSSEGKLIAIISNGFLTRSGIEQRLREELIESDIVELVISLPGGLLMNTGIPVSILVLNKRKRFSKKVGFVDAKNYIDVIGAREKILRDEDLIKFIEDCANSNAFKNKDSSSDAFRLVENGKIRKNDYNLFAGRYFQPEFDGTELRELTQLFNGERSSNSAKGKLVRIKDLKDDSFDFLLDYKELKVENLEKYRTRMIDSSCLLLSIRWRTLKPTYFLYEGNPIYITSDTIALKVDETIVDIPYLINELGSDYVKMQLDAYRIGSSIPMLRRDDLASIKIKLPSLKEQAYKLEGLRELAYKIKVLELERNALAHGQSSTQFNEFASLKHTLGRPRQNILDWSDNLLDFLGKENNELEDLNMKFKSFYDINIIAALNEIKRDINFITEILEKGENGFTISDDTYPNTIISFAEINSMVNEISSNGYNFKIKKYLFKGEKTRNLGINGNITLLKILIENILTNAKKHGFLRDEPKNEVVIELKEVDDNLILEIKNNGKPFQKNFDKEKFISKYSTANPENGSGLGGYDINRIAEYFENKDWELILNSDPIYPVKFKFQFNINII